MADIDNIKPPGPVWPQPNIEKVNHKKDHSQQQRHDHTSDKDKDNEEDDSGVDEYA